MLYAQRRYWSDHPRVDQLVAAYLKVKPKYTPPPARPGASKPRRPVDWSLLDEPGGKS